MPLTAQQIKKHIRVTHFEIQRFLAERRSAECALCRRPKQEGDCFCINCYFGLPPEMRNLLYVPMHKSEREWAENYLLAKVMLRNLGFHKGAVSA